MERLKISILGGGWLGSALATALMNKYDIQLSTRSKERYDRLTTDGYKVCQVEVTADEVTGAVDDFLEADILIINITPDRSKPNQEQFAKLRPLIEKSNVQKVLFISSTSVYPMVNREVTEDEGVENKDHLLYKSEQYLSNSTAFETTVIRMAGLIGGKRHPGRFFARSGKIKNAAAPVNLIHQEDCIQLIEAVIDQGLWGEVFNGCCDDHPTKAEFYPQAAHSLGLPVPEPTFEETPSFKVISNKKAKTLLGITFKRNNLKELIDSWT